MTLVKCIQVWLALFVLTAVLVLVFVPTARLSAAVQSEVESARATLGTTDTDRVVAAANRWHSVVFSSSLAVSAANATSRDSNDGVKGASYAFGRILKAAQESVSYVSYLAIFRVQWLLESAVSILLFVAAASVDGWAIRRRRAYSFAYTSTVVYNASAYVVLTAAFLPLFYLILPFPAPPALLPAAGVAIAGAVWVFFAHLPGAAPIVGMTT